MAAVSGRNTKPELRLRRALHTLGLRYRLHAPNLPGKPDLVLSKHRTVIFVHGCFWHRHTCKAGQSTPASRREFWERKLNRNVERDMENRASIRKMNWRVIEVWECELTDESIDKTVQRVVRSMSRARRAPHSGKTTSLVDDGSSEELWARMS